MSKRLHRCWQGVVTALAGAAMLSGCTPEVPQSAAPRAVRVLEVQPREAQDAIRYTGSILPRLQIDLAFKVGGRVAKVGPHLPGGLRPLQEGDPVKRGQLLAWLDAGDMRRQAGAAAAALSSTAAQVEAAAAAQAQAEAELQRARSLFSTGNIARAELDRLEGAFTSAQANFRAAKGQRWAMAEQQALASSVVGDTRLKSPVDGTISRRLIEAGESVVPGKPAFTVIDTSEMRMVFGVPDILVNSLEVGRRVPVSVDALPGETLVGTVSKISPVADPSLRSYAIEVSVPNAEARLKVGMVASVELERDPSSSSIFVPLSAVVRGDGGKGFAVCVVDNEGLASVRPVELGDIFDNDVVVGQGLAAGDRVVTDGAQLVRAGERVEVVP